MRATTEGIVKGAFDRVDRTVENVKASRLKNKGQASRNRK